jgi:serine/threonine-protein kinase
MSNVPTPPAPEFLPFQKALAGRYSIEGEVGRGGMGIVFMAREVALDRIVALKLLPPEMAARADVRARFLSEARTAARLSHPNIVPIYTVDEVDGFVFFAMAYVGGGTLGDRIRDRGPLSNNEAVRLLREVAWALGHAHVHGVVHRDVKPDNILLEEGSGRALVTDFGIALATAGAGDHGERGATELVGTAEFMSPEQARGAEVDARSDLYSLGCVAYHALSGRVPFSGQGAAAILAQHLTQAPAPLLSVAPQVPTSMAAAVDRCLRKEPDRRFTSADTLAEALGPKGAVDRELPVPLRVFIKQSREFETTVAWCTLGMLPVFPLLVSRIFGFLVLGFPPSSLVVWGLAFLTLVGIPVVQLVRIARRLLGAGFTLHDGVAALAEDVKKKDEEFRFQVGERTSVLDGILRWTKRLAYTGAAISLPTAMLNPPAAGWLLGVFGWSFVTGIASTAAQEILARLRGDVVGERWLRVWKSWGGRGVFKLAKTGLKRVAAAVGGAHRPTEVALGLAADRLFEELPKETQRSLKGLPETVRALEDDAQAMRAQVEELDAVLAEVGDDDPTRTGAEERAQVRAAVQATRDDASGKLTQAVKALETIRLGLLMMHAGGATVESLTMDLRSAQDISQEMENLLAAHREVERLLQQRRKTGVIDLGASRELLQTLP